MSAESGQSILFCPGCKGDIQPVYSKRVFRYLKKICQVLKRGEVAEVLPNEWICEKCKVVWHIEAKSIASDVNQEAVRKYFPTFALSPGAHLNRQRIKNE